MPTSSGYSGKGGSVIISGVTFPAHEWTATPEVDEIDVTNFTSRIGGAVYAQQQVMAGVGKINYEISLYPNAYPAFFVGDVITITLRINDALIGFGPSSARVTAINSSAGIAGAVEMSISATSLTSV